MKLFTLMPADFVNIVDPGYSEVCHVNLARVAYLQELRRKPNPNNPHPRDSWHFRVDGRDYEVTEAAFLRIKQALGELT